MSTSSETPRIRRKNDPQKTFARTKYRKALPDLWKDFDCRCAYSMVYLGEVGDSEKHIDHFDPASKKRPRVKLGELMLASPHCNLAKGDKMPLPSEKAQGIRFLNPCKETEYGVEIFEDPDNFQLVGTTPRAKWHIIKLALNAPHLIRLRAKRSEQRAELEKFYAAGIFVFSMQNSVESSMQRLSAVLSIVEDGIEKSIPPISPPPISKK